VSGLQRAITIAVGDRSLAGTIVPPAAQCEGVLFIHGWAGDQRQYLARAHEIAALGCMCLTFDLYGHAATAGYLASATPEQNCTDVLSAYDLLTGLTNVDPGRIAVIGSSYGGYLAVILTKKRPVRWLGLRAPALYLDEDWTKPKLSIDRTRLMDYRLQSIKPEQNQALSACADFSGDVLLVESENDLIVPAQVGTNYRAAFRNSRSLTYKRILNADHALSESRWQQDYTDFLVSWARRFIVAQRRNAIEQRDEEWLRE
jgi:pimeloyl-ACP methyl ester carboxylesterase